MRIKLHGNFVRKSVRGAALFMPSHHVFTAHDRGCLHENNSFRQRANKAKAKAYFEEFEYLHVRLKMQAHFPRPCYRLLIVCHRAHGLLAATAPLDSAVFVEIRLRKFF
ncbi:MAG: hypothetical protein AAB354_09395, partial [candidate division KSB1 bacterium]